MLKSIRLAIDEDLLGQIDSASSMLGLSRSAFIHEVLRQALEHNRVAHLERRHAMGYAGHPIKPGEFDVWVAEQAWGEA